MASVLAADAQSRKYIANFSLFQQYYNPALTGYEGSMVKTFYRNQWTGFEDAPRTMFFSAEMDLADLAAWKKDDMLKTRQEDHFNRQSSVRHAFGLSVLHDQFGPFKESQVFLSYGSRVKLTEDLSLRFGSAISYSSNRLDGSKLTVDQEHDPQYQNLLGQNTRMNKIDFNAGLMLTADKFYLGYAMQDITQGELVTTGYDFMKGAYTVKHVGQAGYRRGVSDQIGLIINGLYQYDEKLGHTLEGQLKAVFQNMFWLGAGYRNDLAYTVNAGLRINQMKIGYAYEMPTADASSISQSTNEIMLTFNFISVKYPKYGKKVTMW